MSNNSLTDLGQLAEVLEKIRHNAKTLSENYLFDSTILPVSDGKGTVLESWNTVALLLANSLNANALLVGEPGWGKTTAAAIASSASSGLPLDLYRSAMIKGHPNQFEEKMTARPDFGKMHEGIEKVIWQKALYLPSILLDEFNRLKEGNQAMILDEIATGRFSYMNDTFYAGKKSFFATINHKDNGNYDITPPNLDRFHLSLEFQFPGALYNEFIAQFSQQQRALENLEFTTQFLEIIQNNDLATKEKRGQLTKLQEGSKADYEKRTGLKVLSADEHKLLRETILRTSLNGDTGFIPLDQDALLFWQFMTSELNMTAKYGVKRSSDPVDGSNHGIGLASYNIKNGYGPRGFNESLLTFAKALALYSAEPAAIRKGEVKVGAWHMMAIAPYAMAHRLEFTDDYKAKGDNANANRTTRQEQFLSSQILGEIRGRFDTRKNLLYALDQYVVCQNEGKDPKKHLNRAMYDHIQDMIKDPQKQDHPFLREYAVALARRAR